MKRAALMLLVAMRLGTLSGKQARSQYENMRVKDT